MGGGVVVVVGGGWWVVGGWWVGGRVNILERWANAEQKYLDLSNPKSFVQKLCPWTVMSRGGSINAVASVVTVNGLTRGSFWCLLNTKITLKWAHKQFVATTTLSLFLTQQKEPTNENQKDDFHISTPHLVCCSGDDVTTGCVKLVMTSQLVVWSWWRRHN